MYLISMNYGIFDDFTNVPLFICKTLEESVFFIDFLDKKQNPFWEEYVINYFGNENYIPEDISFHWEKLPILEA